MAKPAMDELSRARSALYALDAGCDGNTWVRIGMAAKAAGLSFDEFDAWSETGGNYGGQADTHARWSSFRDGGGIGAATLFHLAREQGWQAGGSHSALPRQPPREQEAQAPRLPKRTASEIWALCTAAPTNHGYIVRKGGSPKGMRIYPQSAPRFAIQGNDVRGWLVLPMVLEEHGEPVSLQFIPPHIGPKLNLPGHQVRGFFAVGSLRPGERCYVVEGIGAAWSAHAATGLPALVSFGAGNQRKVATTAKTLQVLPVLVADRGKENDCERIARDLECTWVSVSADLPKNSDINDVQDAEGLDAVSAVLKREQRPAANDEMPKAANDAAANVEDGNDDRPVIEIRQGERAQLVSELAAAIAHRAPYFRRDALLVRAVTVPADEEAAGIFRHRGSILLRPAKAQAVIADVSRVARVVKYDGRARKQVACDLPDPVAQSFCELGIEQHLIPSIVGVVQCPVMRENGSLNTAKGYDAASRLILAGDEDWTQLNVPDKPTRADALKALHGLLATAYRDFPFADEASKAVAVSALLTAVIRPAINCAPVHGFSAPQYGAGKSLQADFAAVVATGSKAAMMAPGHNQEEFEKRVDAAIIAGDPVVILDNLSRPLSGDNLCAAITSDSATVRPLGSSTQIRVRTSAFWMATGQNLAVKRDMHRRSVIGYIDAQMERPETRSGFAIPDLLAWAAQNRMSILSTVYTILRAHAQAGYPTAGEKLLGNFEAWSRRVAHCLVWLDMTNPVRSQDRLRDDDPELQARAAMMQALADWQEARTQWGHSRSWTMRELTLAFNGAREHERPLQEVIGSCIPRGIEGMSAWLRMNKNITSEHQLHTYCLVNRGTAQGGVVRWEVTSKTGEDGDHGGSA